MIPYANISRPFSPGFRPLRAAGYYAQRIVTPRPLRRMVRGALAAGIGTDPGLREPTPAEGRDVDLLRRDGGCALPPLFPPAELADVRSFFAACPPARVDAKFDEFGLGDVIACPHLLAAIGSAPVLRRVAAYLGCTPTLSSLGVRRSQASAAPASVQHWHRDYDDWHTVKLFVYLSDVGEEDGPFQFVPGSHLERGTVRAEQYTEQRVGSAVAMLGPAGTTFMADVRGIHRGRVPQRAGRLVLQAGWSMLPNYALSYTPLATPASVPRGWNPYVSRLIATVSGLPLC